MGTVQMISDAVMANDTMFAHDTHALFLNVSKLDSEQFGGSIFRKTRQDISVHIPRQFPVNGTDSVTAQVRARILPTPFCECIDRS